MHCKLQKCYKDLTWTPLWADSDFYLLLQRAPNGISLTGVRSLMTLLNISSSLPMAASFLGLAVRSLPSPRRAFPLERVNMIRLGTRASETTKGSTGWHHTPATILGRDRQRPSAGADDVTTPNFTTQVISLTSWTPQVSTWYSYLLKEDLLPYVLK